MTVAFLLLKCIAMYPHPFIVNCSTVNFVTVVFYCSRLSYHQFLVENIPEGLHSLLPVAPTPNYRFTEEQGINFKFLVLQSLIGLYFLKCTFFFVCESICQNKFSESLLLI